MMRLGRFLADGLSTVHVSATAQCVPPFARKLHLKVLPVRERSGVGSLDRREQEVQCCRSEPAGGNKVKYGLSYQ